MPLKDKKAASVASALDVIFSRLENIPVFFYSDRGTEFSQKSPAIIRIVKEKYHMQMLTLKNGSKASLVERFNRTLKVKTS